jgi:hypothetical protein
MVLSNEIQSCLSHGDVFIIISTHTKVIGFTNKITAGT